MEAATKKVSAGVQFSWIAVVSPLLSVVSVIALATVVPIGPRSSDEVETSDGGFSVTYELGFAGSFVTALAILFFLLGALSVVITLALRSGRERMSIVRAGVGLLLLAGIVLRIVATQPN
ncbi:MAG: hypothetical protein VCA55_02585 [Verrucomicrobiales bacterium]